MHPDFIARTDSTPGTSVTFVGGGNRGEVIGFGAGELITVEFTHPANKERSAAVVTVGNYHPSLLQKATEETKVPEAAPSSLPSLASVESRRRKSSLP